MRLEKREQGRKSDYKPLEEGGGEGKKDKGYRA